MAEYEANVAAVRAKTERLRALRLARDAAAGTQTVAKKTRSSGASAKSGKKQKAPKGTLADWLTQQQNSGRNT